MLRVEEEISKSLVLRSETPHDSRLCVPMGAFDRLCPSLDFNQALEKMGNRQLP
jgi:hypothetical protein